MAESQKLQFPLERTDKYKAKIIFSVSVTNPPSVSNGDPRGRNLDGQVDITQLGIGGSQESGSAVSQNTNGNQSINVGKKVVLYMPPSLQINDGVDIGPVDLMAFGAGINKALGAVGGASTLAALFDAGKQEASDMLTAISGNASPDMARALIARYSTKFLSEGVAGAVTSALQTTPNPNTRAIFRSVNMREFSFIFKLQPTTQDESDAITNIIKFFRTELYPETIKEASTGLPVAYRFPNKFDIKLVYGSSENRLATKIKKSHLKSFSATYNPSSMSFLDGGKFSEVDISMTFMEEATLTKDDILGGY